MAGSLNHIIDEDGSFKMTSIDNLGDASEALEECFHIIYELAGGDMSKVSAACNKLKYPDPWDAKHGDKVNPMRPSNPNCTPEPFKRDCGRMDPDIFEHGQFHSVHDARPAEAEAICTEIEKEMPNHKVDWHYVAGRCVVKTLHKDITVNRKPGA